MCDEIPVTYILLKHVNIVELLTDRIITRRYPSYVSIKSINLYR